MPKSNGNPQCELTGPLRSLMGSHVDVQALLGAELSADWVAAVARVALAQRDPPAACPRYLAALDRAIREEPPLFATKAYADTYRSASANGQWLAISLMTAAEREGDGARRLWSLAACASDASERRLLKRHACDESSHALAYLALLDLAFPGAVDPSFRAEMDGLSPRYSMRQEATPVEGSPYAHEPSVDDYVQMNIAEIRTTVHHLMQRPALAAHCPSTNLRRAAGVMNSMLRDKLSHVAYTAVLIERKADGAGPDEFRGLLCKGLRDFNRATSEEPIEYSYNQRFGNYP